MRKFGWILNFDPLLTWMITDAACSEMQSMISWLVNFFLSLFITFRKNLPMSIIPSPFSFSFALHLEWSLFLSDDIKSDAICILANLCSTLFSLCFKFPSAWFYYRRNGQRKWLQKLTGKNLNADRQFFKDVIRIFWCYSI